ncbi:hypothetical protein ONZ45_g10102 [Pleurotus djamor]|nr:hypothetical protein ONZ45_g10102 [Pleurotus djamor]
MSFPFVHQYAVDTPSTRSRALSLAPNVTDPSISNTTKNAVLDLVLTDELSFASAMWFYKASGLNSLGCANNKTMVDGLVSQTRQGWEDYITGCIFTQVSPEREAVWNRTIEVLNG